MDQNAVPWTQEHGRRFPNRPKKLSLEMILRKSFKEILKDYAKHSSLAGVRQMCDSDIGIFQRLIWIAVFLTAVATSCYFLVGVRSDTLGKPLIVTMETPTYPISKTDFPAVAVCNVNRISMKAMKEFALEIYPKVAKNNESLELVEWFVLQWGSLIDFSYNASMPSHPVLTAMMELYRFDTQSVVHIMRRLAPNCNDLMVKCAWGGEDLDCKRIFHMRRTSRGHCCTFNFVMNFNDEGKPERTAAIIRRQNEAGDFYGLKLILDPMLDDYAYPLSAIQGFDILLFPPTTYPDPRAGRVIHRIVEANTALYFLLESVKQVATPEVRKYSPSTRKCYFQDENKAEFNDLYSYVACIISCRVKTLYTLCKCTPYFMAKFQTSKEGKICTIEDLRCLNKYKEKLYYMYPFDTATTVGLEMEMQESLSCPQCLPDCEHIRYNTQSYRVQLSTIDYSEKDFEDIFSSDYNMTNMSLMSVFYPVPDSTLDRLDAVYYWFEIMSNIGGFAGIFLGFSICSVVEIVYFLFIRFFQVFLTNYRKFH